MRHPESWRKGSAVGDLETPCWIVDDAVMHANLQRMAELAARQGVRLRPHIKTHKTPALAQLQLREGAPGIATATFTEAELMADAGITDIFVVYQPSDAHMRRRIVALAERGVQVACTLDDADAARALSRDATRAGVTIGAYLEVNISDPSGVQGRCGVTMAEAPRLAAEVANLDGLRFRGILGYRGIPWLYARDAREYSHADLERTAHEEAELLNRVANDIRAAGVSVAEVVAGSTPSAPLLAHIDGITEIQPGEYIFYGGTHVGPGVCSVEDCALSVRTTVVSAPAPGRAVVNAGSKVFSGDINPNILPNLRLNGYGIVRNAATREPLPGVALASLSEEHGSLSFDPEQHHFAVGDVLDIIPAHVCTCVNLANALVFVRDGVVTDVLDVGARGHVW